MKLSGKKKFITANGAIIVNLLTLVGIIPKEQGVNYVGYVNAIAGLYIVVEGVLDFFKKSTKENK